MDSRPELGHPGRLQRSRWRPGTYTVKLTVGGETFTQELEILKDPRSDGTLADIQEMVAMQLQVREDITTISGMINEIEWMKKQLNDLIESLGEERCQPRSGRKPRACTRSSRPSKTRCSSPIAVEGDSKSFRFPNMLYSKMSVLGGDLAESVDFAPNQQQSEVHRKLKGEMVEYQAELNALMQGDVAAFNRLMAERRLAGVIMPPGGDE